MQNCFLFFLKFYMIKYSFLHFVWMGGGIGLILFSSSIFDVMWDWKKENYIKFYELKYWDVPIFQTISPKWSLRHKKIVPEFWTKMTFSKDFDIFLLSHIFFFVLAYMKYSKLLNLITLNLCPEQASSFLRGTHNHSPKSDDITAQQVPPQHTSEKACRHSCHLHC